MPKKQYEDDLVRRIAADHKAAYPQLQRDYAEGRVSKTEFAELLHRARLLESLDHPTLQTTP